MKTVAFEDPWTCPECLLRVEHKIIPVTVAGRFLGLHPARACPTGHEFLDEEVVASIYRRLEAADRPGRERA